MKKLAIKGKKIGVIGLARSGIAAANLARRLGARVLASEMRSLAESKKIASLLDRGIETEFGGHSDRLLTCDLVIKSPGVHGIEILERLKQKNIPVWSEIEFAARLIRCRMLVAITGTNGKTTSTDLAGRIFKATGQKTVVGGNIGAPLAALAPGIDEKTNVVLEMSSYQLEDSPAFRPRISAILNITPDHMEHHHTMANYAAAKARIFARQGKNDFCVLNYDDPRCRALARKCPSRVIFFSRKKKLEQGVFVHCGKIEVRLPSFQHTLDGDLRIPGQHNLENALACVAIAAAAGIAPETIENVMTRYQGVEHRIEFTAAINGVEYFNDSKGTNVDSTRVALESFSRPVWLILGGRDKGSPYAPLRPLIRKKVKGILLIGEAAGTIKEQLSDASRFFDCGTISHALKLAAKHAVSGDIVLLSPACASFDQFKDYEDRGRQFKRLVRAMMTGRHITSDKRETGEGGR